MSDDLKAKNKQKGEQQQGEQLLDMNEKGQFIQAEVETKPKEDSSSKKKLIIGGIILLLLFTIVGCFIYFKKDKKLPQVIPKYNFEPRRCVVFGFGGVAMSVIPLMNQMLNI